MSGSQTMHSSSLPPIQTFGPFSRLLCLAIVAATAFPLCSPLPHWLQPSLVGCCWGGLTLVGLGCSWSRRRLLSIGTASVFAALAYHSLGVLTDLTGDAAWLLIASVLAGGWIIGWSWTPWVDDARQPTSPARCAGDVQETESVSCKRMSRWTIWDLAGLASLVAVVSALAPRIGNQLELLARLAPAAVGGALVSLLAIEWGWRDVWSPSRLLAMAMGLASLVGLILCGAPVSLGSRELLVWALAGPASAMAAQGLTVLSAIAARRLDTFLSEQALSAGQPSRLSLVHSATEFGPHRVLPGSCEVEG